MIKKSLFEDELIAGMQRELTAPFEKKAAMGDLVKAADYLEAAVEIFEEAGMTAKADQVLRILGKIAIAAKHETKVQSMPSLKALMEAGVTHDDLKNVNHPVSKAKVNTALRTMGYTDKEIHKFLGKNFMSENDAADILNPERPYSKIMDWIQNPTQPVDPNNPQPGEEISFQSLPKASRPGDTISFQSLTEPPAPSAPGKDDLVFKSIAESTPHKTKNPTNVSDSHTKGLTSEKMVANLKGHGTVFNMADDGINLDDNDSEDLLDLDINEAAMETFQENPEDKTFEDSD